MIIKAVFPRQSQSNSAHKECSLITAVSLFLFSLALAIVHCSGNRICSRPRSQKENMVFENVAGNFGHFICMSHESSTLPDFKP